jgi:hypothetical protein
MSSGIIPTDGSVCCICWEIIPEGQNARDASGQAWDVHQGLCAVEAGLEPPSVFVRFTRQFNRGDPAPLWDKTPLDQKRVWLKMQQVVRSHPGSPSTRP